MNFSDAVIIENAPPVSEVMLSACKRTIHAFAVANSIPLPVRVNWTEGGGSVRFVGTHQGREFGIFAKRAE